MPDTPADAGLNRRLDPAASGPLAVAFSGGSDSLAMLVAAKTWGDRVGRRVVALTVDHGLNPDSARWTAGARRASTVLGADWIGLSWTGAKPSTGLPAAGRQARHRLLAQATREAGANVILFGHTSDDRQESELIRKETPGLGYLREWSPSPVWPEGRDIFVLRPLLQARRANLRGWLTGMGLGWLDDPANLDPRYARSRARAALAIAAGGEVASPGVHDDPAVSLGEVCATDDGRLIFPRQALAQAPTPPLRRLIGSALLCVSGGVTPPRGQALDRLLDRLRGEDDVTATLCGARIVADRDQAVFAREAGEGRRAGAVAPGLALPVGEGVIFDGRFELLAREPGLRVAPALGRLAQLQPADTQAVRRLPTYARGSLPILLDAKAAASLPAPFGSGAAIARGLIARRFIQACGAVRNEAEINAPLALMAPELTPPYVRR